MSEEFNEKFETIEQTLKYIADSQAKFEWIMKKSQKDWEKRQEEYEKRLAQTQKHLDYITKLTGIAFEDLMFQDEKLEEAGKTLTRKNPKRT
ncbi:MAG: hypothetical protein K1X72_21570 [Pyrinomonadaceae bacterium]|nr:hypothetical protein [Pyrinomonadaceae bacterium]